MRTATFKSLFLMAFLVLPTLGRGLEQKQAKNEDLRFSLSAILIHNLDSDLQFRSKDLLAAFINELATIWKLKSAQSQVSGNLREAAKTFSIAPEGGGTGLVTPHWCGFSESIALLLSLEDAQTGELLRVATRAFDRPFFARSVDPQQKAQRSEELRAAARDMAAALNPTETLARDKKSQLIKFGIMPRIPHERFDRSDFGCETLLFSQELLDTGRILPVRDMLMTRQNLRVQTNDDNSAMRPQRMLHTTWSYSRDKKPNLSQPKFQLPDSFDVSFHLSDAVFGQRIVNPTSSEKLDIVREGNTLKLKGTAIDTAKKLMSNEMRALNKADQPLSSKVYGAWVYVDRGRAWGLRLNDRLVSKSQPDAIKGHVVGFFGPELNIKSPRGFPIAEGAIIYVRKGQRLAELGQEWDFDRKSYPTPWPPQ